MAMTLREKIEVWAVTTAHNAHTRRSTRNPDSWPETYWLIADWIFPKENLELAFEVVKTVVKMQIATYPMHAALQLAEADYTFLVKRLLSDQGQRDRPDDEEVGEVATPSTVPAEPKLSKRQEKRAAAKKQAEEKAAELSAARATVTEAPATNLDEEPASE